LFEFGAAHLRPTWTAVLPGHVVETSDSRVLLINDRFWLVEPLVLGGRV
jgi:hypothetical protein